MQYMDIPKRLIIGLDNTWFVLTHIRSCNKL